MRIVPILNHQALHEAIYCDANAASAAARAPSNWAAERVQASRGETWDYATRLEAGAPPVQLTGEMVYSWMGDDFAWLRPLKPAAELLAAKADWGALYDPAVLGGADGPPVAALVSYEDIYVERAFSEATARLGFGLGLGLGVRLTVRVRPPSPA